MSTLDSAAQSNSNPNSNPSSDTTTATSEIITTQLSNRRLSNISGHMGPTAAAAAAATAGPTAGSSSVFTADRVPQAPEDPLFGLMTAYRNDTFEKKVDLGIGAYRDNNAKPWVLPVVKKADEILRNDPNLNHEYLPISGLAEFTSAAQKLMLGADSPAIKEKRVTTLQTISGTGALHLGALFLSKFFPRPENQAVYFSNPTWANHNQIFSNVHIPIKTYPYFSIQTKGLDFDGMYSTIESAPQGSIILLHACAHNPTGVDLTKDQWIKLSSLIRKRNHFPFFDCAYQGFASGDLNQDAWAIRYFISQGFELCIAQSFAKNFGLYGERAGAFHFVTSPDNHSSSSSYPSPSSDQPSSPSSSSSPPPTSSSSPPPSPSSSSSSSSASNTITRIASQLAICQRSEISNPPAYGARIASTILNDPPLFSEWEQNLLTMSGRIKEMRSALRLYLEELNGKAGSWKHITDQIGMFSFTGLSEGQVKELRSRGHIYMTKNGRISMAGLNTGNLAYVAEWIDRVVRETESTSELK